MAAGYKPGHPSAEPQVGDRGAAPAERAFDAGSAPRTRRWAPRANADGALPPLANLNPYNDDDDDDDGMDAEGGGFARGARPAPDSDAYDDEVDDLDDASESETGEQDRPNLARIEHGGTEEFSAPSPKPRSGKRRATGPVLIPRDVDGPARDSVAVPTRIEEPRIDLDLALARRDEDDMGVPPRLRGRNLPADRARSNDAPAVERTEASDDPMMASFTERSGPRLWIVVAVLAGIGFIALLLGITR